MQFFKNIFFIFLCWTTSSWATFSDTLISDSLIEAIRLNNIEKTQTLLALLKASPNTTNHLGVPVLAMAAACGQLYLVSLLLDYGASVDLQDQYHGWTPLMHACLNHHPEIVIALLKAHANPYLKNKNGDTAIDVARKADSSCYILLHNHVQNMNISEKIRLLLCAHLMHSVSTASLLIS